jgi:hypothetical protein
MKTIVWYLFAVLIIPSCNPSAVKQSFSGADSVVIHFIEDKTGLITKTKDATEPKAIRRLIEFIDANETEQYKCGYDGKMIFFSKGEKIQEVDFKMKDESCNHFIFLLNGRLHSTRMSREAANFLNALEKGLPQYW